MTEEITLEKLQEMQKNEKFVLVEALSPESYAQGHIPGAVNVPVPYDAKLPTLLEGIKGLNLKKTDTIVTYCADKFCLASVKAAELFKEAGFTKVLEFREGKKGWVDAGLELEK